MRLSPLAAILAVAVSAAGCDLLTDPAPSCEGPFVETVEPVRSVVLGDSTSSATVLVDIYFPRDTARPRPTRTQLEGVRARGGEIRRVFQIQAVRADIPLDGLHGLYRDPDGALVAVTVPDPALHTVSLSAKHAEETSIRGLFQRLGGIVRFNGLYIPWISGYIDDTSIACLQADDRVLMVEHMMDLIGTM